MVNYAELAVSGVRSLIPYRPGKPIGELERELGLSNIVKLASNENPLGASPKALAAARAALGEIELYPDGGGFDLKAALSRKLGVAAERITLGNGSSEVLEFAARVFVSSASEVMFSQHSFALYPIFTQILGAKPVETPASAWGNDLDAMRQALTPRTRLIFIANPNNPTGTWIGCQELERFLGELPPDVLVMVDEAYFEYASHPAMGATDYPDTLTWIERYPNLIVARTFSKCYGLAGLRVGYSISHPDVADLMNRVRPPFNVSSIALAAATAALDDEEHLQRSLDVNAQGMRQLTAAFTQRGLDYIPSVANFVCVDLGRPAPPLYDALLRQGVIVRPVGNYDLPNHLRVTIGTAEQNEAFLRALDAVL